MVVLNSDIEAQVRGHITSYRAKGYSDDQIRQALVKSGIDSQTISSLMGSGNKVVSSSASSVQSIPFYRNWKFVVPVTVILLLLLFFFVLGPALFQNAPQERSKTTGTPIDQTVTPPSPPPSVPSGSGEQINNVSVPVCGDGDCEIGETCDLDCGSSGGGGGSSAGSESTSTSSDESADGTVANITEASAATPASEATPPTSNQSCVEFPEICSGAYTCNTLEGACFGGCTSAGIECKTGYTCVDSLCVAEAPYASVTMCESDADCGSSSVCVSFVCYTAECSDTIDNDADGSIDMDDSDCTSITDNSESSEGVSFAYAPAAVQEKGFFARLWAWIVSFFTGGSYA
ncbi:hypothetical protein HZA98_04575 [Candidatus Woesearchaeota archaeon]|nr:hypothetical protein [Candidatus Woesearchaeota archaeon]